MKNNLKKNFIWNLIGSTVNSFTSLIFLIIVTRINGITSAGLFTFAFANACFLQVIGIYATRSYQITEKSDKLKDSDYIYTKIITIIVMIFSGILFSFIRGYNTEKFIVIMLLILYKALDAFSESIYAIMQKKDYLYKVGISLFLKGVVGSIIFLICDYLTNNMILSIIVLVISNIIIVLLYDFITIKKLDYKISKFNFNKSVTIIKLSFWTFVFTLLTQYLLNAPKYAIDSYLPDDAQTIYGIISMPASLMVLISSFIIHPFLVQINNTIVETNYKKLNNILIKMILSISIITIIGIVLCYFIGIPILNLLYNIKIDDYLIHLLIIILGAGMFAITIIISNILIAMRKTLCQTIIFLMDSLLVFVFSKILVYNYNLLGAASSYLLSMIFLLISYIAVYIYIVKKEGKNEIINSNTSL